MNSCLRKYTTILLFLFVFITSLLVFHMSLSYAGWLIYHKPEFRGKVIDGETKEPIEGAVVVATYKKHPIISGPAGGSSSIIHTKEALTDKNGEFYIPSYTRLIQPNSKEDRADFIIYKPGYASYPGRKVYPLSYCGPEYLFSKELGAKGEIRRESKVIPITYGIVELPLLKTRKERLGAIPGTPTDFRSKQLPLLYEAINDEYKRFGLREVK